MKITAFNRRVGKGTHKGEKYLKRIKERKQKKLCD
jgi:hypothetical protein